MLVCYFHSCLSHQLVHHNCAVVKYQISICNGYWYIIYHIYCSNIYSNYHILNTMVCMYIYIISYMLSCKYNLIIINYLFIHMRVTGYDTKMDKTLLRCESFARGVGVQLLKCARRVGVHARRVGVQ